MTPFVAFCLRAPPIALRGGAHGSAHGSELGGAPGAAAGGRRAALRARARAAAAAVAADLGLLVRHPVYLWTVAGMTVYTAVLGAFAFYGPKAGRDVFGIAPETADLAFGAITVLTGARPRPGSTRRLALPLLKRRAACAALAPVAGGPPAGRCHRRCLPTSDLPPRSPPACHPLAARPWSPRRRVRHAGGRLPAGPHGQLDAQRAAAVRGRHAGGVGAGGRRLLGRALLPRLLRRVCRRRARHVCQPGGLVLGGLDRRRAARA